METEELLPDRLESTIRADLVDGSGLYAAVVVSAQSSKEDDMRQVLRKHRRVFPWEAGVLVRTGRERRQSEKVSLCPD